MSNVSSPFGQNEWLVEEMYRKFRDDPSSVDPSWHEFLVDYNPESPPEAAPADGQPAAAAPQAQPAAPAQPSAGPTAPTAPASKPAETAPVGNGAPAKPDTPAAKAATPPPAEGDELQVLRGAAAAVVKNMSASLDVPTATSVRAVPAKLLIDNRIVINNQLKRTRGGKISFTHLLGYALVQAVKKFPNMNRHYAEVDGKPTSVTPAHTNLGLAIDLQGKDGKRSLVVAGIKRCEELRFAQFVTAYEDIVRRARDGKLTAEDFAGVTISLTNPGTIGTVHSVPRLMAGQGAIIGVGAMEYPAEFQGASAERIAELGIGKLITLTSTYDHRIIQGAESGDFLRTIHEMLLSDAFWDEIFRELSIPYLPVRWSTDNPDSIVDKNARVMELIAAYRNRGHLMADIDPLRLDTIRFRSHPDLEVLTHGLTLWDLDRVFKVNGFAGCEYKKLRDVLGLLRDAYCRHIGVEYTHILDPEQQQVAGRTGRDQARQTDCGRTEIHPEQAQRRRGLRNVPADQVRRAEAVLAGRRRKPDPTDGRGDRPVRRARPGRSGHRDAAPRPAQRAGQHRRQAVLADLQRVRGQPEPVAGARLRRRQVPPRRHRRVPADVRRQRHSGIADRQPVAPGSRRPGAGGPGPGQAGPAGQGRRRRRLLGGADDAARGRRLRRPGSGRRDAEPGELLPGYRVGGTIHVIVNNQIGFTTAPEYSRSSEYCTDVAKMIGAPIFHVNGDDPEACVWVARLAVDFRQQFKKDVIIDMLCYRRRGHNEGDDPSMTNPYMYDVVDTKRGARKSYTEALIGRGDISMKEAEDALRDYQGQLERVFNEVRDLEKHGALPSESVEADQMVPAGLSTAVDKSLLARIGDAFLAVPEGFTVHPRVLPVLEKRREMAYEGKIDWAFGELLALGSLVAEGKLVRLSGQDTRRGTFSQRHSVIIDRNTGEEFTPLQLLATNKDGTPTGGKFLVYDSPLSEYATVGFEYGYTVGNPDALVLWEGQFGDFVNGAQSIIDEFISSGEAKWGQLSNVVLLLPHGHEGQGPDHTSGRIERFLQLWAEGSMTIAVPSTPAELLPLVAPARARRHPAPADRVHAEVDVAQQGRGQRHQGLHRDQVPLGAGGAHLRGRHRRPQQGHPDPADQRQDLLRAGRPQGQGQPRRRGDRAHRAACPAAETPAATKRWTATRTPSEFFWVQEEPANQGAWPRFGLELPELLPDKLTGIKRISRRAMSAPSSGSSKVHAVEQQEIIDTAFS